MEGKRRRGRKRIGSAGAVTGFSVSLLSFCTSSPVLSLPLSGVMQPGRQPPPAAAAKSFPRSTPPKQETRHIRRVPDLPLAHRPWRQHPRSAPSIHPSRKVQSRPVALELVPLPTPPPPSLPHDSDVVSYLFKQHLVLNIDDSSGKTSRGASLPHLLCPLNSPEAH